jgi:hypothetical protein
MGGQLAGLVWLAFVWLFLWYAIIRPTLRHHRAVKIWRDFHVRYLIRTRIHPGSREMDTL